MEDVLAVVTAWPALSAGLLGLLVGSFLNVVILRLPPRLMHQWRAESHEFLELSGEVPAAPPSLVHARSQCPNCGHQLAWWENVPVLSFVVLRGKCRGCAKPISWQYPIVEALTGALSAVVAWNLGVTWECAIALLATWYLIAMSGIDLRTQLLPDQLTLPLLWLGLLAAVAGMFQEPSSAIVGATVGYLGLWSVYWAFKLLTGKEGMGYGDFKLLAALGAFCGVEGLLPIVLLSSLFGAIIGASWLALRGRDRATPIPFGPFLAAAGWTQLMFGAELLALWRGYAGG
jgi:leader peptidase (prepilin peptidase)/N-methyltransferase